MVVAQLVEWLLPTPEVRGMNPSIGKIHFERLPSVNCIEKTKIKKKRCRECHIEKRLLRSIIRKKDLARSEELEASQHRERTFVRESNICKWT